MSGTDSCRCHNQDTDLACHPTAPPRPRPVPSPPTAVISRTLQNWGSQHAGCPGASSPSRTPRTPRLTLPSQSGSRSPAAHAQGARDRMKPLGTSMHVHVCDTLPPVQGKRLGVRGPPCVADRVSASPHVRWAVPLVLAGSARVVAKAPHRLNLCFFFLLFVLPSPGTCHHVTWWPGPPRLHISCPPLRTSPVLACGRRTAAGGSQAAPRVPPLPRPHEAPGSPRKPAPPLRCEPSTWGSLQPRARPPRAPRGSLASAWRGDHGRLRPGPPQKPHAVLTLLRSLL